MTLDSVKVERVAQLFDNTSRIVILTHTSPDGDALGSSLGLCHYLKMAGKEVYVITPNGFPDFLSWMPDADHIIVYENAPDVAVQLLHSAQLIVCTDFNEPKRIGALGSEMLSRLKKGECHSILIDHHPYPDDFADVVLSLPELPSASIITYYLLEQLTAIHHHPEYISLKASTCLYTGMMTDTGNFSFNSNFPDMYRVIADLLAKGVNKDAIYNRVFNAYSEQRMRLLGFCLNNKMRIFPEQHTALIYLSRNELYKFQFRSGDAEGIVNFPLQIKNIYYSCFMREDKVSPSEEEMAAGSPIKVKISMRSQGQRPVNTFCQEVFHGGGHANASGGEYYGSLADAVKLFLENYKTYFKN